MNLVSRIAGAARLLATGKLALSTGFDGAQMQRRLVTWRAGGESINSLILQGGELQRARARQLVRTNPYASNAVASFTAHAIGCGIKPSSLVEDGALKDRIQRLWLAWTDEADADGLTDFYGLQAMAARAISRRASASSGSGRGGRRMGYRSRCSCRCSPPSTCRSANAKRCPTATRSSSASSSTGSAGGSPTISIAPIRAISASVVWASWCGVPAEQILHVFHPIA